MYKNKRYRHTSSVVFSQRSSSSGNVKNINENEQLRNIEVQRVEIHENEDKDISQASVPASQPPTQRRYLSQRSLVLSKTQSKPINRAPNSYFEMVLMKSGADLDQDNAIFLFSDNVTFVNRLCNILQKNQDIPNNVQNFIEGLEEYLSNSKTAIKLLSGCSICIPSTDMIIQSQDSMITNFLMVDILQEKVIIILLNQLEIIIENDTSEHVELLPLIMSQLKSVVSLYTDLLYDRIIKLFKKATPSFKSSMISNIEFVLDPVRHNDFVTYLLDNCSTNEELLNYNTVNIFTNFCLNSTVQEKLRRRIVQCIKDGCNISLLSTFTKYLLSEAGNNENIFPEIIPDLRYCLYSRCPELKNDKKALLEIFTYISQVLIKSRKMSDYWQKFIQNLNENELKSIDFIMLLMIVTVRKDKLNNIENLLRRWIKQGRITINVIVELKTSLGIVLEEYKELLFQILHCFLREKDHILSNFTKQAYRILFGVGDAYQKKILMILVESICDKTMLDATSNILEVLKNLNEKYVTEIQNCGLLLLPILDHINEMDLNQVRTVMELLCSVSYPQPPLQECQILKDHIDMLVKKQIVSQIPLIKKQGIIGIAQLIRHIVCVEDSDDENISNLDKTYKAIDDLPEGRGKIAASYIIQVLSSNNYCIESLALFYDEMAKIFSPKNKKAKIDRHFLNWFCDLITTYFQNYFVVEEIPLGLPIKVTYQNCINTLDTDDESEIIPIAINIAGCVLKPPAEALSSICVLAPLFSLMNTLHFLTCEGSLERVNAVLGCAIIFPDLDDKNIIEDYDEDTSKKIIDIHFHLINWYREAISSFANQNDVIIKEKVLLRLNELINLQDTVRQLLSHSTTLYYTPPPSEFTALHTSNSPVFKKSIGKPRNVSVGSTKNQKRDKNEKEQLTEGMSLLSTTQTENRNSKFKNHKIGRIQLEEIYGPKEKYRQMDFNIMLILKQKLVIKFPLSSENIGNSIGLLEFRFILTDLVNKLESVTNVQKITLEDSLSLQHVINATDLINDVVYFLPIIMNHFKELMKVISNTIEAVNNALGNAELFTDEFNLIKVCHGLCLRLFAAIFHWSDFDDESNQVLLKNALYAINYITMTPTMAKENCDELAEMAFFKFIAFENCIIDLKSGIYLYNLCLSLCKFTRNKELQIHIRDLCRKLLCKKWYNYTGSQDKGTIFNILIDELLKGFFKKYEFKKLEGILKLLLDEIKLIQKKDNVLKIFPNIHRSNFSIVFKHLCLTLIDVLNENIQRMEFLKAIDLQIWEQSCEILNLLLNIVKFLNIPRHFSLFLKYSHIFLKIFLQYGMPVFENFLIKDPERVNELLKSLQTTTRYLHNLCCHSKAIKNSCILSQIPFVRETIENLLFKVKAALAANKCLSVFWMGDLKNKDLYGESILSQISQNNDEDDEDLPNDDNDDEIIESTFRDGNDRETIRDNFPAHNANVELSQSSSL